MGRRLHVVRTGDKGFFLSNGTCLSEHVRWIRGEGGDPPKGDPVVYPNMSVGYP
jgi:hypothetical protein